METIEISYISTTNTSEYKFLSLRRSDSKRLGNVYPLTYGGILSPELMVVPLILIAATPVGSRIRTFGLSGDLE